MLKPWKYRDEVLSWKKEFEDELREMYDHFDDNFKYLEIVRKAHQEMIKEILGEKGK